ncbi:restriction endonuclease subunit S [Streptomyces sp. NPDC088726]|uniref:restriction endonuclease subunit S n=1 Tax=Streptomyces sp. NPDC088726 TaxID=3365874 RepID=UPI0038035653
MDDWKVVCVADVAAPSPNSMATGPFGSSIGSRFFRASGVPVIRGGNLSVDSAVRINDKNLAFLTRDKAAEFSRSTVLKGDLIFTSWGTINQVGLIDGSSAYDKYVISNKQMKLTPNPQIAEPEFLYYLFSGPAMQREILEGSIGSSIPGFNLTRLRSIEILLPPVEEQRRIARALTDVERLEKRLCALIDKKQAIKRGAMQQLLTGRTRLQGFGGVWEYRRVAEMGDVLAGKALNVSGAGVLRPYLRTKNVLDGRINLEDVLWMPMTDAEFERFRIEREDVLLNEGQSLELVGRCSMYNGEFGAPCAMQNQLLRFRANPGTSPKFAAHLFRYCQQAGIFTVIATKTTSVAHLGSSRLGSLRLLWPADRREQGAIAEVLSDMDTEITAYEVRLDKARALKQGMMQQLLAGRARLSVMESAA